MSRGTGRGLGPWVAVLSVCVAVTLAVAQPGEVLYPRTCNAPACVNAGSTFVLCDLSTDQGCCCKFSGQTSWTCQCVDEVTCLNDTKCRANVPG